MYYAIVERKNHFAVHCIAETFERAQYHLNTSIPRYIAQSYFMDKALKHEDFEIIECKEISKKKSKKS